MAASSVLGEMKDELLHGVSRIEKIEAAVAGREGLAEKLLDDSEEMGKLLAADEAQETDRWETTDEQVEGQ